MIANVAATPVLEPFSASMDKESLDGSWSDQRSRCLMKAVVEFAGQLFRKTITQLTHQDFSYPEGGIISVCTLLNYSAHYIKNHVQQSTERSNPEAQPSIPWTTNHTCFSYRTRRNRLPIVTQTIYRRQLADNMLSVTYYAPWFSIRWKKIA